MKWQLDKQGVTLRDYAVSALIEKAEEETKYYNKMLEDYRIYYGSRIMTQERYNYLVNRYNYIVNI